MSRLLDDEWGDNGLPSPALIAKHKRLRVFYALGMLIIAPAWGYLLNYIEDKHLFDVDIGGLFFTVSAILLAIYGTLVFKNRLISILYIGFSFGIALGAMVLLVNFFNLNQRTLPMLCFFSGLIVVVLAQLLPIRYKRP